MKHCEDYCGIHCVYVSFPNALADEYPEYGYTHIKCKNCFYNNGCENCIFLDTDICDKKENNNDT